MPPRKALSVVGQVLFDAGSVKVQYIDNILASYEQFGPYFVIAPNVAIAHAKPDETVLSSDIALVVCQVPVNFGSHNDPVTLLFGLCATGSHQHVEILAELAILLSDDNMVAALSRAKDIDALQLLLGDTNKQD